jgi:IS5 family transposase
MLRIYFLQQWFNLSDPQAKDTIYDSESRHRFARVELGEEVMPDESARMRGAVCKSGDNTLLAGESGGTERPNGREGESQTQPRWTWSRRFAVLRRARCPS